MSKSGVGNPTAKKYKLYVHTSVSGCELQHLMEQLVVPGKSSLILPCMRESDEKKNDRVENVKREREEKGKKERGKSERERREKGENVRKEEKEKKERESASDVPNLIRTG